VKGMPFVSTKVGIKGLEKPCETSGVNQKHAHSYIFKINILMKTAYFFKIHEF
jgi:hypothetical protein